MSFTPPTDPADCFALSVYGFGPFPPIGESVSVCPANPTGFGYGGVGWDFEDPNARTSGSAYGLSNYGGAIFPPPIIPISGGYGGDPYGLGPYGSVEYHTARVSSAVSITPWEIEVFFDTPMDPYDPALLDPASYTLTPTFGGPSAAVSVRTNLYGNGILSVIVTHSGTTLGGVYLVAVAGPTDIGGTPLIPSSVSIFTRGEPPPYIVTPDNDGRHLVLSFQYPLEPDDLTLTNSYGFTSNPDYPITLRAIEASIVDPSTVLLDTVGQTSLDYTGHITPATAFDYTASVLPNEDPTLDGWEFGTGTSNVNIGLVLSSPGSGNYGWYLYDLTGKLTTGTTFRADVTFDASAVDLSAFSGDFAFFGFYDGTNFATLTLRRGAGPIDQIRIQSGTFDTTVAAPWSLASTKISLVRNIKAGFYSVLVEDFPIYTTNIANFDGLDGIAPNVQIALVGAVPTSDFKVSEVRVTASATVYSAAWNFLHDWSSVFVGSTGLTRDSVLTNRGPLVKEWGDMTPATVNDVALYVNQVQVAVADVNPHTGQIYPAIPIPLLPPNDPQLSVKVDYHWLATPVMEMTGLNQPGQVLNKWDRNINGHHLDTANPGLGAPDIARFPYCVVLGPMETPQPVRVGHRYIGYEKESSALLNSPTTLQLNVNPNEYQVPGFEQVPQGSTVAYEGTVAPTADTPAWTLVGVETGTVNVDGTYTVRDGLAGSYADPPPCTLYKQDMDMGFPASMTYVVRYFIDSYTTDGVFTGIGFGFHQGKRFYLIGNLLVNGVQHVGLLKDSRNPHLLKSWTVGPVINATIEDTTTITIPVGDAFPTSFVAGDRFQIMSPHLQAGVYTATKVVRHSGIPYPKYETTTTYYPGDTVSVGGSAYTCLAETTGNYPPNPYYWSLLSNTSKGTVTVSPAFPTPPTKWGTKYADIVFETVWLGTPTTYRLTLSHPNPVDASWHIKLALAGATSVSNAIETDAYADMPQVAESSLALFTDQANPDKKIGTAFWGSLSYAAKNASTWSFVRYGIVPDATAYRGHSKTVTPTFTALPEDEADYGWFRTQAFGQAFATAGMLLLKSTSGNTTLDTAFAYGRDEPFFNKDSTVEFTTYLKADSAILGAGDAEIVLNDATREVRLATLSYCLTPTAWVMAPMPAVSFAGLLPLADQGWAKVDTVAATNHENDVVLDITANTPARYKNTLDMGVLVSPDSGERVLEAEFAVATDFVLAGSKTGIFIAGDVGTAANFGVAVTVGTNAGMPVVSLALPNGLVSVIDYAFDWADGEFHTYRVVVSNNVVSLFVDNTMMLPTQNLALFAGQGSGQHRCLVGSYTVCGQGQVLWRSASYSATPHADVHRTVGIYLGGDPDDLDSWAIPRSDGTTLKNSNLSAAIVDVDWLEDAIPIRLLRTWDWGVTVYLPSLPDPPIDPPSPPPTPTPNRWATQNQQPSTGWISVEYTALPYKPRTMGFIGFGSFDPRAVTQQWWSELSFRLFKPLTDDWKAPQHMVLNQANVVTSGERVLDDTLETAIVTPLGINLEIKTLLASGGTVDLTNTVGYVQSVYKILDGKNVYFAGSWTIAYDPDTQVQTLTLNNGATFASRHIAIYYYPASRYLALKPTHLYAHDVYKVVDGTTIYTRDSWTFDRDSQLLTLNGNADGSLNYFAEQSVTVIYYPGIPATDTYLESQNILDSMTLLNEGTPPVPMSQQNPDTQVVYIDGDYKALIYTPDAAGEIDPAAGIPSYDAMYESMKFMDVTDGGWTDLITIVGEGTLQPGFTGWTTDEGEAIYDSNGDPTGDLVGSPIGGHVIWLKGDAYWNKVEGWEDAVQTFVMFDTTTFLPVLDLFGESLGKYLFVSGGSFLAPVVDGMGDLVGDKPAGGYLNTGLVLYPSKVIA